MSDEFSAFLAEPTGPTFLRLRAALIDSPAYEFASDAVDEVERLVAAGAFADAGSAGAALMPNWLLSPRAHRLLGLAAEGVGDGERAAAEGYLARACLRGLLASGDGSPAQPYRVTHPADEYDLLASLGKEPSAQRVVDTPQSHCDVIACADGSDVEPDVRPPWGWKRCQERMPLS